MAITNITDEVTTLRAAKELDDRIDHLSQDRAAFVLKALLLANHVGRIQMKAALDLADTINFN